VALLAACWGEEESVLALFFKLHTVHLCSCLSIERSFAMLVKDPKDWARRHCGMCEVLTSASSSIDSSSFFSVFGDLLLIISCKVKVSLEVK